MPANLLAALNDRANNLRQEADAEKTRAGNNGESLENLENV